MAKMGCPAREERSLLAYQQLAACGGDVLRKLPVDALQLRVPERALFSSARQTSAGRLSSLRAGMSVSRSS
ncbi:MAG: hypothetical protein ACLTKG_05710 [Collinsella intestinalis]